MAPTITKVINQVQTVQLGVLGQGIGQAGPYQLDAFRQGYQKYWDPANTSTTGQANSLSNFRNRQLISVSGGSATSTTTTVPVTAGGVTNIWFQGTYQGPTSGNAVNIQNAVNAQVYTIRNDDTIAGGGGKGGNGGGLSGGKGGSGIASSSQSTFVAYNVGTIYGGGGGGGGGGDAYTTGDTTIIYGGGGGGGGGVPLGPGGLGEASGVGSQGGNGQAATATVAGTGGEGGQSSYGHGGAGGKGGTPTVAAVKGGDAYGAPYYNRTGGAFGATGFAFATNVGAAQVQYSQIGTHN